MQNLFLAEKAPFFITALLAAAGWVLSHTTEKLTQSPVIEYQTRLQSTQDQADRFIVRLCNLSTTINFSGIEVAISVSGPLKPTQSPALSDPQIATEPPGTIVQSPPVTSSEKDTIRFEISEFQPGSCLVLSAKSASGITPEFRLMSSKSAVNMKKRNLETLYIAHETAVLLAGILLWGVLILVIVFHGAWRPSSIPTADPIDYK